MKLDKWRCDNCGFGWFEPIDERSDHNIDHGYPQGCGDGVYVLGDRSLFMKIVQPRYELNNFLYIGGGKHGKARKEI